MTTANQLFRMMTVSSIGAVIFLLVASASLAKAQYGRDAISMVGSSTVYPFAAAAARRFSRETPFTPPIIESTGSTGGLRLFCAGVGIVYPDISNASRQIRPDELQTCRENGVKDILEIKIGYDGIVLASSKKAQTFHLTRKDIFLALSAAVPDPNGGRRLVTNPYRNWNAVNPRLPATPIHVLGPSPTSGTRDAFITLAMQGGTRQLGPSWSPANSGSDAMQSGAIMIRGDGAYIEQGENDDLIAYKLEKDPAAIGVFGFSFLFRHADRLQGAMIDDVAPTILTISSGGYPLSRPLFLYVKKDHIGHIPGIREFLDFFTSEKVWGPDGFLTELGLIPMNDKERNNYRQTAIALTPLSMP